MPGVVIEAWRSKIVNFDLLVPTGGYGLLGIGASSSPEEILAVWRVFIMVEVTAVGPVLTGGS